ncbi:MAG: hypothetical protein JSR59_00505 [Proteobacteria bacterium]|nr:hypothetical protein [Pseudomonadota bacterium]
MAVTKPAGKKTPAKKARSLAARRAAAAAAAEAPRALKAGPQRDKTAPSRRLLTHEQGSVTLEEVLVNFQRSLARATRSSLETARADLQVGMGQRALFVIDSIDVTLKAGVVMARDAAGGVQAVSVDLDAAPSGPGQAELKFRIASRPIDPIATQQITLADLDPLGLQRPSHRVRVTLIGRRLVSDDAVQAPEQPAPQALERVVGLESVGDADTAEPPPRVLSPLPGRKLHLYVVGTTTGATEIFILTTNAVGQADVEIDALSNRVTSGELGGRFKKLDLTRKDSEFFVWAACNQDLADGITDKLTSNVLQFTVKRESSGGADQ